MDDIAVCENMQNDLQKWPEAHDIFTTHSIATPNKEDIQKSYAKWFVFTQQKAFLFHNGQKFHSNNKITVK